jgi:hypothetical protein
MVRENINCAGNAGRERERAETARVEENKEAQVQRREISFQDFEHLQRKSVAGGWHGQDLLCRGRRVGG